MITDYIEHYYMSKIESQNIKSSLIFSDMSIKSFL